jgi:hypothetical protein
MASKRHDRVMAHEHAEHDGDHPLSFHHPSDHPSCVLPEHGSHTQGNHDGEYAPRPTVNPTAANKRIDSRRAGSGT